jgi:geranylgeranyl pyrophosphate synthase
MLTCATPPPPWRPPSTAACPPPTPRPPDFIKPCATVYSARGKRLRPVLCLAAAEAIGGDNEPALIPAAAVEILHTYTLIHDDLPAMDDDALRRGRATCHIAFDEATAILAGDALLTLSFEWLTQTRCAPPHSAIDLVRELAAASGSTGVIGGQMADIEGETTPLTIEQLVYIHTHKTGDRRKHGPPPAGHFRFRILSEEPAPAGLRQPAARPA